MGAPQIVITAIAVMIVAVLAWRVWGSRPDR
jgi:hypothetical protein